MCRLANHANALHSHTHICTQKPPVFAGAQRGLTSHFTRAGVWGGGISGGNSRLCLGLGGGGCRTIATSDQSGGRCMTLEFKFMCCLQRDAHKETMRGTGSVTGENDRTEGRGRREERSRKCRPTGEGMGSPKKSARSWVIWSDRVTVSEASGVHKGMPVE